MEEETILHEEGLYFGLPEAAYHADPALSASTIKLLLQSPAEYWYHSPMNPLRPVPEATAAMRLGTAMHKMVLEGKEAFEAAYAVRPEKENYPGVLSTAEDLKAVLKRAGAPVSGKKNDLIERLLEICPDIPVWDRIIEEHTSLCDSKNLKSISFELYSKIAIASATIRLNPSLKKAFNGGKPEVSVFWEEDGIRFKCRIDYLKPRAVVDFKTFTNPLRLPLDRCLTRAFAAQGYDIQFAHYMEGRSKIPRLVEQKKVFGDHDPEWLAKVAAQESYAFVLVFYKTEGAPVSKALSFETGALVHGAAVQKIADAVALYKQHMETFGEEMWVCTDPITVVRDEELPSWIIA